MEAEDVTTVLRLLGVRKLKASKDGFIHCQCFFAPYADEHSDHYDGKPSMWIQIDRGVSYCECWTCGANPRAGTKQKFIDAVENFNRLSGGRYAEALKKAESCEKSSGRRRNYEVYTPTDNTSDYVARYLKHPAAVPRDWLKTKGIRQESTIEIFRIGADKQNGLVLFPIINRAGFVVGAQARPFARENTSGKYFSVYEATQKSHHLFGEHLLDLDMTGSGPVFKGKGIVVFEGPLDVMHAYEVGVRNVVGVMGSKISPVQAKDLANWTQVEKEEDAKVIALILDPDKAGRSGSRASLNKVFLDHAPGALVMGFVPPRDPKEMTREDFEILLNGDPAWLKQTPKDLLAELARAGTRGNRSRSKT